MPAQPAGRRTSPSLADIAEVLADDYGPSLRHQTEGTLTWLPQPAALSRQARIRRTRREAQRRISLAWRSIRHGDVELEHP